MIKSLQPYVVLTRHFFIRLFQNDLVAFEDQMKEKIITILALVGVVCGHLTNLVLFKYALVADTGTSWIEKCYILSFFMVLAGFLAVFVWDMVFPDSRDFANLFSLPIKIRTLFLSKLSSLLMFVGMFALAMNALSIFPASIHLPKWQSSSLVFGLRFSLSHFISSSVAVFFMFFFNVLLMGIICLLGQRLFFRFSVFIRSLFLVAYFFLFAMFLFGAYYINSLISALEQAKAGSDSLLLYLFPPIWFTGLYEWLIGNPDPFFAACANLAILGLVAAIAGFYLTMGLGYGRYLKILAYVKSKKPRWQRFRIAAKTLVNHVILRNSVQRAVFYFMGHTLKRSMQHKMRLASFGAIAAGICLILLFVQTEVLRAKPGQSLTMLAIPLIFSFFILVGLKAVIKIPMVLDANWIFQLTENQNKQHYLLGMRKAIQVLVLAPLFSLFLPMYLFLWQDITALHHCLYGFFVSVLVMEIMFFSFNKIPFTCSYLPGQEKMHYLWLVYLLTFMIYITVTTKFEMLLLKSPVNFFYFYMFVLATIFGLRLYQNLVFFKKVRLKYEEIPEPVMVGLTSQL